MGVCYSVGRCTLYAATACRRAVIDKQRYIVPYSGKVWEVDEFSSPDAGLVVAEVELTSVDEEFDIPPFIGEEVTGDPRYYNSMLGIKK